MDTPNTVRKLFRGFFDRLGLDTPTQNEMTLQSDAFAVKRKLGRSFFTKKRTPHRLMRLANLTPDERALAIAQGWSR